MPVVAVIPASESEYETAPSVMRYDGDHAPYGYAGFLVDECTVVCPECHREGEESTDSPIFGNTESDYPGLHCAECDRILDTDLLLYESGPGSEVVEDIDDIYRID